jgi:hypothetical protein
MPFNIALLWFIDMIALMSDPARIRATALLCLLAAAVAPLRATGEPEAAIVVDLLLRDGTAPLKLMSSKPMCVQADPPEVYREPFISGTGKLTRVVSLEYRLRLQRNDSRGLLLELTPATNSFTKPRRLELPRDGRSRLLTVWRDDASNSEALFSVRLAEPYESVLACKLRRPVIRPLYHLRATIEQTGKSYDPSRASPQFTAPLGDESSEHYVNSQPRKVEGGKKKPGPEPAPAAPLQPQLKPAVSVSEFGENGSVSTTTVPLASAGPVPTPETPPAQPTASEADKAPVTPPAEESPEAVIVEDRDDFIVAVNADRAGERLKIRITVTGTLATAGDKPAPVNTTQTYTVFRHEQMSLYITGPGALNNYSMSFDPDWEEQ